MEFKIYFNAENYYGTITREILEKVNIEEWQELKEEYYIRNKNYNDEVKKSSLYSSDSVIEITNKKSKYYKLYSLLDEVKKSNRTNTSSLTLYLRHLNAFDFDFEIQEKKLVFLYDIDEMIPIAMKQLVGVFEMDVRAAKANIKEALKEIDIYTNKLEGNDDDEDCYCEENDYEYTCECDKCLNEKILEQKDVIVEQERIIIEKNEGLKKINDYIENI